MKIKVGDEFHQKIHITKEMVSQFMELSGDKNPIHFDEAYAQETQFKHCIVPGMLVAGLLSKIIGMDFPGNGSIYLGQDLKFIAPIYVNTEIEITCIVENIKREKDIYFISNIVKNDDNKIVMEGKSVVKLI